MASRRLIDLQPATHSRALQLLQGAESAHFGVLIYCTLRPLDEQARLYRQGRTLLEIQRKADELDQRWNRPDLASLLMAVGPQYGPDVVTWSGPGQSLHNYGFAIDAVPIINGKIIYGNEKNIPDDVELAAWKRYGELGLAAGFEWAGNWTKKREFPHLQEPGVDWRELIAVAA